MPQAYTRRLITLQCQVCPKIARVEVLNSKDEHGGYYCVKHGDIVVKKLREHEAKELKQPIEKKTPSGLVDAGGNLI